MQLKWWAVQRVILPCNGELSKTAFREHGTLGHVYSTAATQSRGVLEDKNFFKDANPRKKLLSRVSALQNNCHISKN